MKIPIFDKGPLGSLYTYPFRKSAKDEMLELANEFKGLKSQSNTETPYLDIPVHYFQPL